MIQINNLTKKYGETIILDKAEYTFPAKGMVCLVGASGGGKTTLLNLLAGFDTDYSGEITAGGISLKNMDEQSLSAYRRDYVGFVFQDYHLLNGYTAIENVMLAGELHQYSKEECNSKANVLLKCLGIYEKSMQSAKTLSGGQKQRVAIARALMGDPKIIFADEPTGALDRKNSTEIMELLRDISKEKLVVVITHDPKIAEFADEVIRISEQTIEIEQPASIVISESVAPLSIGMMVKYSPVARSIKNLRVHLKRYIAVSFAISIGLLAFLFSLSFGNVMEQSIAKFKEKNTAFNSGYIQGVDDGSTFSKLESDSRVQNVYYQYRLNDINLCIGDISVNMEEKLPLSKATENLSYGVMPREGVNEISISPSLAKKFNIDIKSLVGEKLTFKINGQEYPLTISGIFNAGYDDFFLSADLEKKLYEKTDKKENYSIAFEVGEFLDIVAVNDYLIESGIDVKTAADEVRALESTFQSLNRLFLIISVLILIIGVFICSVLLFKLQNSRYHEVGLLSALGYGKRQISSMITTENLLHSALATGINFLLLLVSVTLCKMLNLPFVVGGIQILFTVIGTFAIVLIISGLASRSLLNTEPAAALKKI